MICDHDFQAKNSHKFIKFSQKSVLRQKKLTINSDKRSGQTSATLPIDSKVTLVIASHEWL